MKVIGIAKRNPTEPGLTFLNHKKRRRSAVSKPQKGSAESYSLAGLPMVARMPPST